MRGATITYTAVPASSWNFNPRAPCGARRQWRYTGVYRCHFNPRAPRGARLALMGNMGVELFISIHARLSGSDRGGAGISIHAPREGRDPPAPELVLCGGGLFQSTRPARGATLESTFCSYGEKFQSTRPARGATDTEAVLGRANSISIHAPREGRDHGCCPTSGRSLVFQSTRPMRGATIRKPTRNTNRNNFNPRAPCGARLPCTASETAANRFQSTRPMRGATLRPADCSARTRHFNPRAPCGARHLLVGRALCVCLDFNPRAPCGARRHLIPRVYEDSHFNPRAPCGARPLQSGSVARS